MMEAVKPDNPSHEEITAVYYVAKEFGLSPGSILKWPAMQFQVILEEMHNNNVREKKAMKAAQEGKSETFG